MLASGWIEASTSEPLSIPIASASLATIPPLPFPRWYQQVLVAGDVMSAVLDFLYSAKCDAVERSENVEFVMNVLVVADQLLIPRLKDVCEASIAAHRECLPVFIVLGCFDNVAFKI